MRLGEGVRGKMTLLYRSPNITRHVTVNQTRGKRIIVYRFRAIGANVNWQPIAKWQGRPPKGLRLLFGPYQKSIQVAMGTKQHARQVRHLELVARAA